MDLFNKVHIVGPMKSYIYKPNISLISLMFNFTKPACNRNFRVIYLNISCNNNFPVIAADPQNEHFSQYLEIHIFT